VSALRDRDGRWPAIADLRGEVVTLHPTTYTWPLLTSKLTGLQPVAALGHGIVAITVTPSAIRPASSGITQTPFEGALKKG